MATYEPVSLPSFLEMGMTTGCLGIQTINGGNSTVFYSEPPIVQFQKKTERAGVRWYPSYRKARASGDLLLAPYSRSDRIFTRSGGSWSKMKYVGNNLYEQSFQTSGRDLVAMYNGLRGSSPSIVVPAAVYGSPMEAAQLNALASIDKSDANQGETAFELLIGIVRRFENPLAEIRKLATALESATAKAMLQFDRAVNRKRVVTRFRTEYEVYFVTRRGRERLGNGRKGVTWQEKRVRKTRVPYQVELPVHFSEVRAAKRELAAALGQAKLAYQFGLKNALQALTDVLLAASSFHENPQGKVYSAVGTSSKEVSPREASHTLSWNAAPNLESGTFYYRSTHRVECRAVIYYRINNPVETGAAAILKQLGLDLRHIPTTAWAVVRFSWIIDQIVSVSRGLLALGNLGDPNYTILGAVVTKREQFFYELRFSDYNQQGWVMGSNGLAVESLSTKSLTRRLWTPTIWDTIPTEFHWPDINALLTDAAYAAVLLRK